MDVAHPLINLAGDPSRAAREALVAATVSKLLDSTETPSPGEQKLFADVLVKLYVYARHEIRERLSTALATADWAPPDLVRELALDIFDIAQPIISFCPTITDEILIEVIDARDKEHRICIAERACIGEGVSAKLIDTGNGEVIGALARNVTAKISSPDFKRAVNLLVNRQDDLDAMVSRHDLPANMVAMAFHLAGEKTRLTLSLRLPAQIEQRLARLTTIIGNDAAAGLIDVGPRTQGGAMQSSPKPKDQKPPTPGILIAALMRGEREIFFDGLSSLLRLPHVRVQQQIMRGDLQTIALATRAVNFDMTIVRTIYETLQIDKRAWAVGNDNLIAMIWMRYSPETARMQFAHTSKAN
jgi:uncharacterized protein (DUF2336 family)